jgi:phage protein D
MSAAAPAIPVYKDQDFYVPSFQLLIRGLDPNIDQDVVNVTYSDSLTNIDSFDITVNNHDPDKATLRPADFRKSPFKYSDTDTFTPWQEVELFMGYIRQGKDERRRMLVGEIVTMTPSFPTSGGSTLTARALNLLHRFRTKQQQRTFLAKKDSEIAQILVDEIAKDIRKRVPQVNLHLDASEIKANLKREQPRPSLLMDNLYPINFLMQRARDLGYELTVEEKPKGKERDITLHFRPTKDVKTVTLRLDWGVSLMSFQPSLRTARQVGSVTVRGWDPKGKTKIEETVTRGELGEEVIRPSDLDLAQSPLSERLEITVDHPIQSKAEAKEIARSKLLQIAQDTVEGKGKTVGIPEMRSGCKLEIGGLGKRFSGVYVVTSTTHTIGEGGYTTDFSARMEAPFGSL